MDSCHFEALGSCVDLERGRGDGGINRCVLGSCCLHDERRDHFRPEGWRLGVVCR